VSSLADSRSTWYLLLQSRLMWPDAAPSIKGLRLVEPKLRGPDMPYQVPLGGRMFYPAVDDEGISQHLPGAVTNGRSPALVEQPGGRAAVAPSRVSSRNSARGFAPRL
jgi:hypothetical protein